MAMHNAHMIWHFFVGYGTHFTIIPPAPPPPVLTPHMSSDTLLGVCIKADPAPTDLGMGGQPLIARGSDSGLVVPHYAVNSLLPIIIAFGGSKVMFGSSKVKIAAMSGSKDCGCCVPPFVPFSMNLACNDPCSYPSDYVVAPNTVEVGMTLGDILGGVISMAVDIGFSWVCGQLAGKLSNAMGNMVGRLMANEAAERAFFDYAAEFGENWIAKAAAQTARSEAGEQAAKWLEEAVMGKAVDSAVQEWITKPLVESVAKPVGAGLMGDPGSGDPTEAGQSLGHNATGEGGNPADPPVYDSDNPGSNPNVNVDDDAW